MDEEILQRLRDIETETGAALQSMRNEIMREKARSNTIAERVSDVITALNSVESALLKVTEMSRTLDEMLKTAQAEKLLAASKAIKEDLKEIRDIYMRLDPRKVQLLAKFLKDMESLNSYDYYD